MKHLLRIVIASSMLCVGLAAEAQDVNNCMKWDFKLAKQDYSVGDELEVLFTVSLKEGWRLILANQPKDTQPAAVVFEFAENGSFEVLSQVKCQVSSEKPTEQSSDKHNQSVFRSTVRVVEDTFDLHGFVRGHLYHEPTGQMVAFQQSFRF